MDREDFTIENARVARYTDNKRNYIVFNVKTPDGFDRILGKLSQLHYGGIRCCKHTDDTKYDRKYQIRKELYQNIITLKPELKTMEPSEDLDQMLKSALEEYLEKKEQQSINNTNTQNVPGVIRVSKDLYDELRSQKNKYIPDGN